MATIEQLQRTRLILSVLLIINSISMVIIICFVDDYYYYFSINMFIYFGLAIAFYITIFRLRRQLLQQTVLVPVAVVHAPNTHHPPNARVPPRAPQGPPPPPGFITGATDLPPTYSQSAAMKGSDAPPPYSQEDPWTTQQSATGFSQPSTYSQSAFGQTTGAGGQPFSAFNEPGQNTYWNPAQTS